MRVSVVALQAGLLHVATVPVAHATVPRGSADIVDSPAPGRVRVAGWAYDPDETSRFVSIHVYGNTDPTPATFVVVISAYATLPPPPPGEPGRTVAARAVKKKSRLRASTSARTRRAATTAS